MARRPSALGLAGKPPHLRVIHVASEADFAERSGTSLLSFCADEALATPSVKTPDCVFAAGGHIRFFRPSSRKHA
jgi:hypothetical protein